MRVAHLAEAIADGDLTVRTGDDSNDALGHLSSTFDQMAAALASDIARRERVEARGRVSVAADTVGTGWGASFRWGALGGQGIGLAMSRSRVLS